MGKKKVIVVGGGISGILASYMLSDKYYVTLLEGAPYLGGLLTSRPFLDTPFFIDYGTHILKQTGIKEIDRVLFDDMPAEFFEYHLPLRCGTYYKGITDTNGFISDHYLPSELRQQALDELISLKEEQKFYTSLEDQLTHKFGKLYTEFLLRPAIEKLYGCELKELAQDAHLSLGLARIIVGDNERTKILKTDPVFDEKLSYHSFHDRLLSSYSLYPKKKGLSSWIQILEDKIRAKGVKIVKGTFVSDLEVNKNKVSKIFTQDQIFDLDHLIWAVPIKPLINVLDPSFFQNSKMPTFLSSVVVHLQLSESVQTDLLYLTNYDPTFTSFRYSFYDNYLASDIKSNIISVEFRVSGSLSKDEEDKYIQLAFNDLINTGLLKEHTYILASKVDMILNAYPRQSYFFNESMQLQNNLINDQISNITLMGRASGRPFFMNDVILDCYKKSVDLNI